MATTYPEKITDRTGRVWTWSESWGGYRSEGMVTHGYDTIRDQWGIAPAPSPLWGDISITLADRLRIVGVSRSVAEVDGAIQTVLESERDASDSYALPSEVYVEEHFDDIVEAVCEQLDVDYDIAVAL